MTEKQLTELNAENNKYNNKFKELQKAKRNLKRAREMTAINDGRDVIVRMGNENNNDGDLFQVIGYRYLDFEPIKKQLQESIEKDVEKLQKEFDEL